MTVLERIGLTGLVPVVVIDNADDAVQTARALMAGGVDIMEITMRTEAGLEAIRRVTKECPDMLVGAGTVLTLEKAEECVKAGAKFIVAPGFDEEMVRWCLDAGVVPSPGCVTPTEITKAMKMGLNVVKFFPANVYGGIGGLKALSAPFGGMKFIPTGGVSNANLAEFADKEFIFAVGGGWLCSKEDIASGNFDKITKTCREAVSILLGFEFAHLGINTDDEKAAGEVAGAFSGFFGLAYKEGSGSIFAGSGIEVMKKKYLGECGHIAIRTNSIPRASDYLKKLGLEVDEAAVSRKNGKIRAAYFKDQIGKFAVHLLQK